MNRVVTYPVQIQFGDCDPAGIVFFPNFSRWMDAASLYYFMACGVLPWRELVKLTGIVGTPLLEIHTRFVTSATYGETIEIHTSVEEWHTKTFVQKHVAMRGEDLICEGRETRIFVERDPSAGGRLRGIPIPADIKAKCTGTAG
jgi:4-hydroxybenzoyl-CoA thioesterase